MWNSLPRSLSRRTRTWLHAPVVSCRVQGSASDGFYHKLSSSIDLIDDIAQVHGKITAITEIGYRSLETENGYFEGLAPMDNTVKEWFTEVLDAIMSTVGGKRLAYMLIWANFSDTQFWLPFATEDFRHEMCDDFIKFAEDGRVKMAPVFDFND